MNNKGSTLYKIIVVLTLALPVPIYLFLSAVLFKIVPDFTINATIETIEVEQTGDKWFVYSTDTNASYGGLVVFNFSISKYGLSITSDDIIKIDGDYYKYDKNDDTGIFEWTDIKKFEIQKTLSYKLPISFLISLVGLGIVASVIAGKMKVFSKYPRISALGALLAGTVILSIINLIIDNLLGVFLVATISWAVYCIEHFVYTGKISKSAAEEKVSKLEQALKEELK